MRKEKEKKILKKTKKKKKKKRKEKRKEKERKVLNRSDTLTLFEHIFNQRNTSSKRIVRDSVMFMLIFITFYF